MVKPFLSIIIPVTKNNSELPIKLIEVDQYTQEQDFSYEILIVLRNTSDTIEQIIARLGSFIENLRWTKAENEKRGDMIREGIEKSRGAWRLIINPDNSVPISEFNKVLKVIQNRSDVILGTGDKQAEVLKIPANILNRWILKLKSKTAYSSFMCLSEDCTRIIYERSHANGSSIAAEIILLSEMAKLEIVEVSVQKKHRLQIKDILKIFDWIPLKYRVMRGYYEEPVRLLK